MKILVPFDGGVQFDQAKVLGPISEGEGTNSYYGFRIELGPAHPETAINILKAQSDTWSKR